MSGWIYKGTRLFQVLQGSIMLPCEAMFMQGGTTILVSLGFLCVPAILLCVAAIRKSTRFLIAGLIAFGIVWNFATWIGCILSWMD
jgi:hypothetical protein